MTTKTSPLATRLHTMGRNLAHSKGYTVELDIDATAYTGPSTDHVLYGTPANEGVRMTITHSLEEGRMAVYAHPEDEDRARAIITAIEAA